MPVRRAKGGVSSFEASPESDFPGIICLENGIGVVDVTETEDGFLSHMG